MTRRPLLTAALFALAVLTLAALACSSGSPSQPATPAATTAASTPVLATSLAPWPAPVGASAHIAAAGLEALPQEQLAYHIHAHLDIFVDGTAVPVAAGIGIDLTAGKISPLHTHDTTGIIHIESAQRQPFTLGQFFAEWAVRLDPTCVGGYCSPDKQIRFYLDGSAYTGDPSKLELAAHQEIAVVIGTPPATIPNAYTFPAGS